MIWKLLALAAGWASIRYGRHADLIVYRDGYYYTGPLAWRLAAQDSIAGATAAAVELVVIAAFVAAIFVIGGAVSGRL